MAGQTRSNGGLAEIDLVVRKDASNRRSRFEELSSVKNEIKLNAGEEKGGREREGGTGRVEGWAYGDQPEKGANFGLTYSLERDGRFIDGAMSLNVFPERSLHGFEGIRGKFKR